MNLPEVDLPTELTVIAESSFVVRLDPLLSLSLTLHSFPFEHLFFLSVHVENFEASSVQWSVNHGASCHSPWSHFPGEDFKFVCGYHVLLSL